MLRARSSRFRFSTSAAVLAICLTPSGRDYPEKAGDGLALCPVRSGDQRVPELDRLRGARARLADRDHTVLGQRQLLVVQDDLPAVAEGDVGAVAAVVAQDEVAAGVLDGAVLARGGQARQRDVALVRAAEHDRELLPRAHRELVAAGQ